MQYLDAFLSDVSLSAHKPDWLRKKTSYAWFACEMKIALELRDQDIEGYITGCNDIFTLWLWCFQSCWDNGRYLKINIMMEKQCEKHVFFKLSNWTISFCPTPVSYFSSVGVGNIQWNCAIYDFVCRPAMLNDLLCILCILYILLCTSKCLKKRLKVSIFLCKFQFEKK